MEESGLNRQWIVLQETGLNRQPGRMHQLHRRQPGWEARRAAVVRGSEPALRLPPIRSMALYLPAWHLLTHLIQHCQPPPLRWRLSSFFLEP